MHTLRKNLAHFAFKHKTATTSVLNKQTRFIRVLTPQYNSRNTNHFKETPCNSVQNVVPLCVTKKSATTSAPPRQTRFIRVPIQEQGQEQIQKCNALCSSFNAIHIKETPCNSVQNLAPLCVTKKSVTTSAPPRRTRFIRVPIQEQGQEQIQKCNALCSSFNAIHIKETRYSSV